MHHIFMARKKCHACNREFLIKDGVAIEVSGPPLTFVHAGEMSLSRFCCGSCFGRGRPLLAE